MSDGKDKAETAQEKIIAAAQALFSEKGFDATRVDDIARAAGINKALIYYYFKSKDDILTHLIQLLFSDIATLALAFVKANIVTLYEKGHLDIRRDRWTFSSERDAQKFYHALMRYEEKVVDYALAHRQTVRILILESLKDGKYHNALFRLQDLLYDSGKQQLAETVCTPEQTCVYSAGHAALKFFFGFIPVFNFAAYFDACAASSGLSEKQLRASFLHTYQRVAQTLFNGTDLLF